MEFISGISKKEYVSIKELAQGSCDGKTVRMEGMVHAVRDMGDVRFVILRKAEGLVQCVYEEKTAGFALGELKDESAVRVAGVVYEEARAPFGRELRLTEVTVLSEPSAAMPLPVSKWKLNTSLEAKLNYRPLSLRNLQERAKFRIQEGIARGFREFLTTQGFTEIRTPKIGAKGAEGGSNVFKLDYFHRPAVLAQSPQFYKQMMVGVFERVYEIAPVFRAEKHDTARHLNEYTSVDFEMGYIENFEDIMAMEQEMLRYTFGRLQETCGAELSLLKAEVPVITEIPRIRFSEAKELVSRVYKRAFSEKLDFEPEEEKLLCEYVKKTTGSDFVFVTHYPSAKRPFYAMDSRENPAETESFDLLFRGLEVTTGGQRIHNYREQVEKIESRGMHVEAFESYLMMHRCGMPPHGGLGLGLERFTARLLGFENVRNASLFPRDIHRLIP